MPNKKNSRAAAAPATRQRMRPVGRRSKTAGANPARQKDFSTLLSSFWKFARPKKVATQSGALWREAVRIARGVSELEPDPKDARFRDPVWKENPYYRSLAQAYLAVSKSLEGMIERDAPWQAVEREKLLVEILTSAMSPTNTLLGNPQAIKRFFETGGQSLVSGIKNMLRDAAKNRGMPSQVDATPFAVGRNLAVSPGQVVFRNEVLELLQYQPSTEQVFQRPTLIVTPQINKFYFLDLAPGRSFVEFSVAQGIQTFVVSWRNPGPRQRDWNLDTYLAAVLECVTAVCRITGSRDVNAFGFCAGGITMAALASHLVSRGDPRFATLSFAVTLLDLGTPALIGILNSPRLLDIARARSSKKGVIEGRDLASVFSWLRPNDLVWNYWVNNYLLGKSPPSFDVLAWNSDCTNLPAGLHGDFLNIFQHNPLVTPGAWCALGTPVDLGRITCDAFVTGAMTDHLTPWKGCYRTTQLLGGDTTFVLSYSGHVASLINPPSNPKSSYWTGPKALPDSDEWLRKAKQQPGSWWTAWAEWIGGRSGERKTAPRELGHADFPPLAAAPGSYVLRAPG